jgi:hypothetical protein
MEFGLAFSFPFKDPDWFKKLILTGLITLIPVLGQIYLAGWAVEITRRVIKRDPQPLPEINFGEYLGKGFQVIIIGLVYSIPAFIIMIPIAIFDSLGANANTEEFMRTLSIIVSLCCGGIFLLYSILLAFLLPAAIGNFAAKGTLGAGLAFGDVFRLVRSAPVAYLVVLAGMILAGIVASLGTIACVIGVLVTAPFGQAISAHLTGQAYNEATAA